jgi:hypothetical protein
LDKLAVAKSLRRAAISKSRAGGSQRAVYQDDDGRQFVIDDKGQAVYGIWILPDEALTIVES